MPKTTPELAAKSALATMEAYVAVLWRFLVSTFAVGLPGISSGETFAAKDVLAKRDGVQVLWIDARSIATKMIERQAFWYRSSPQFIADAMRRKLPTAHVHASHVDKTVSIDVFPTKPNPASIGRNGYFAEDSALEILDTAGLTG